METSPDALYDAGSSTAPAIRAAKDISFGSIAGMISKIFEHPFDLTKVRLQAQVMDASARYNGPVDCLVQTWKTEGISGLYRGLPAPIVGAMAENATLFLAYSELQNVIRWSTSTPRSTPLSLGQLGLAAGGAGAITSFVLTPIELVKCRMQVQMLMTVAPSLSALAPSTVAHQPLPGPIALTASILRTHGLSGLWLGHTGTLIRETGGSAAWFTMKEFVARILVARRSTPSSTDLGRSPALLPWESALSGACAGAAYNIALFPADTVKSSIQTEAELRPPGTKPPQRLPTFTSRLVELYAKQGVRGLYAGCGVTIVRSVPSSAIIFLVYDGLVARFG
ncbi:hypothetical protein PLICRDRAFT_135094 [Plicaturopsis crispa FD-325 SS-3]|nr:hypothetical protein PLICRDRAFT_135094 [Plicaturopsis crispa FD-325 SS-3]